MNPISIRNGWYIFLDMSKYFALFCVILGLSIYISHQDKRGAMDRAQNGATLRNAASSAKAAEGYSQENIEDTRRNEPSWFGFFRWPDGTTAWAIILTLFAIAEQTGQTRIAAEATKDAANATLDQVDISKKALIAQFRPKIRIRSIRLIQGALSLQITLANKGDTDGHVSEAFVRLFLVYNHSEPDEINSTTFEPFTVIPGVDVPLNITFEGNRLAYGLLTEIGGRNGHYTPLNCEGEITYADNNGTKRKTRFKRLYNNQSQVWTSDPDPEYEYED